MYPISADIRSDPGADCSASCAVGAGLTRAAVGGERKATGDVCALMTRKLALSTMKPPLMPVPEVGGVLYLRAANSIPSTMVRGYDFQNPEAYLGNVG